MKTLQERITEDNITATVKAGCKVDSLAMDSDHMNKWTVTLRMNDAKMTTPFFTGFGLTGDPTPEDVLSCLLSDAGTYENAQRFEEWASEYGYDSDSRKAEKIFHAVERLTDNLRHFLGDKYQEYLWDTEAL